MSFNDNVDFIKQLAQRLPHKYVLYVLYRPNTEAAATDLAAFGIKTRPFKDGLKFVMDDVSLLMSAKLIICDNYYAFLGGLVKLSLVKIVQIWHADGAIKKNLAGRIPPLRSAVLLINIDFKKFMIILMNILSVQKRWAKFLSIAIMKILIRWNCWDIPVLISI